MGATTLTAEAIILVLRFALLLVLYLFLWQLVAVIWRDLHRPAAGEDGSAHPAGRLVVVGGGNTTYQPGHTFPIHGTVTIGRGPDNSLVLDDSFVSTSHAILTYRQGGWWVADLESRNGTSVNDQRIDGEVGLRPGDVVAFGSVKLKLAK